MMAKTECKRATQREAEKRAPLRRGVLEAASLSCGMVVMVVEMVGSR